MFTGIIEEIGVVERVIPASGGRRISISCSSVALDCKAGESVAVNGVCLTVAQLRPCAGNAASRSISADVLGRTWELTNLRTLLPGAKVNLERALRMGDRVGGHFVLGHVDGVGTIRSCVRAGQDLILHIEVDPGLTKGIVTGGSVAVDGVSLTVDRVGPAGFDVHLIPTTLDATTLGAARPGGIVNIELDLMGKHLRDRSAGVITEESLRAKGF